MHCFSQDCKISYSNNGNTTTINFELINFSLEKITTSNEIFSKIKLSNSIYYENKGYPEIPFVSAKINVSDNEIPNIEIEKISFHDIKLDNHLIPSRGTIYRNQNPDSIPYLFTDKAISNDFYPQKNVITEEIFSFRGKKEMPVRIFPFSYNFAEKTLRVYDRISIKIANSTKRYTTLPNNDYGDILVLSPEKYDSVIQPFIKWKREKGYNVLVEYCDSAENVSSRITEIYSRNPNLLYVQLVGDWNDIQSNTLGTSTCYDCPTDPTLGNVDGGDDFPDLAISRFSCSNAEELAIQIEKSINYEKNPNNNRDWREKFIGIGSGEGPGDDDELDYEHISKIYNRKLSDFTYNVHSEHYENGTNVSSNQLATSINLGSSSIAYCGHGSGDYWLTGSYSGTNVTSSSNENKLPFVISVACRNGTFHEANDCFAEKWLKAPHGGAVVTLMSSINQAWFPPMRGQDYFYDILSGGYDYENDNTSNGLSTNEQNTHWGSIILNSFYLMLSESAQTSDIETVKTWISFGDASLQLRTKTPEKITASQKVIIEGNEYVTNITTNGNAVSNALVCISQNGRYYKGFTNSRGVANISHNFESGKALLVVTAFNTTTIYDSIPVISSGNPYITIDSYSPNSINFGESSNVSINLKNSGNLSANNLIIKLLCEDEFLNINSDSAFVEIISENEIVEINDFYISVSPETPYGHIFNFSAQINYNDTTVFEEFTIELKGQDCYAPENFSAEIVNGTCQLSWNNNTIKNRTIFDNFDNSDEHPSFEINSAGNIGWTYNDIDNSQTIGITDYTFVNNREKMAFIIVNPELSYSDTSLLSEIIHPHSGNQFIASFAAISGETNDMIISPKLNFCEDFEFSFYVRGSHKPSYWETMLVYYITENSSILLDSCRVKGSENPDNWTLKSYTVPDSAKYVAIKNSSTNKYFLCIDDIKISGNSGYTNEGTNIYDNGNLIAQNINDSTFSIANLEAGEHCFNIRPTCNTNISCDTTICLTITYECIAPEIAECYRTNEYDSIIWTQTETAESYNIYDGEILIANTTDTTYIILTDNNLHEYSVSSVCQNAESEVSIAEIIITNNIRNFNNEIAVFPNPSNGDFIVKCKSLNTDYQYSIIDICGKELQQGKLNFGENKINLRDFANGIYTICISTDEKTHYTKIIKQ